MVRAEPVAALRGQVSAYYGFRERAPSPVRRREGPGAAVVVILSFGEPWLIDGARRESFVGGLHRHQVTTEHAGRSYGIQIDLEPQAAHVLFREPMHRLANSTLPLEDVLAEDGLTERLHDLPTWPARFALLDSVLARRLLDRSEWCPGVARAWARLVKTGGQVPIASLTHELGWSRKRIAARFREQIGLTPKAAARLLRFERARAATSGAAKPDWVRIALECGYYDQSHLINDFRDVTGRSPATFFQDPLAAGD